MCMLAMTYLAVCDEFPEAYAVGLHLVHPVGLLPVCEDSLEPQLLLQGHLGGDEARHRHARTRVVAKVLDTHLQAQAADRNSTDC